MKFNHTYCGDALEVLKNFPSNSVDCGVTSPPYYRLRNYGIDGQIGLEESPEEYVEKLVRVFREFYRVLKPQGTLWINIADSYSGSGKGSANYPDSAKGCKQETNQGTINKKIPRTNTSEDLKEKDLIGIPWMLAFALRGDGWYLRNDIIWNKPNPMPESVTDRCTKAHEYIFFLTKSKKYYFDSEAIAEETVYKPEKRKSAKKGEFNGKYNGSVLHTSESFRAIREKRNKRDVWTVSKGISKEDHFAVFPEELITPCVLAGCPHGGIVLDMFFGSGTTGKVAIENFRKFVGIDINPKYVKIADNKLKPLINQIDIFTYHEK